MDELQNVQNKNDTNASEIEKNECTIAKEKDEDEDCMGLTQTVKQINNASKDDINFVASEANDDDNISTKHLRPKNHQSYYDESVSDNETNDNGN